MTGRLGQLGPSVGVPSRGAPAKLAWAAAVLLVAGTTGCRCGADRPAPESTDHGGSSSRAATKGVGSSPSAGPPSPVAPWTIRRVEGPADLQEGALLSGLVPVALPAGSRVVLSHRRGPRVTLTGPFSGFIADDGDPLVATVAVGRGTLRATVPPAGPTAGRPRVRVAAPGTTVVLPAAGDVRVAVAEPEDGAGPPVTRVATLGGVVELRQADDDAHPEGLRRRLPPGPDGELTVPHPAHHRDSWSARVEAALADALTAVQAERERGDGLSSAHRAVAAGLPPAVPPRDGPGVTGAADEAEREVTRRRARALQLQSELVAHARTLLLARERLRFAWERVVVAGIDEAAWAGEAPPIPVPPSMATLAAVRRGLGLVDPATTDDATPGTDPGGSPGEGSSR